jgi:hypothetical protein
LCGPSGSHPDITYTIGDDVVTQYDSTNGARHLLYDGHGSTRHLVDNDEDVTDAFSYDGYGVMLGANPGSPYNPSDPNTNLLYTDPPIRLSLWHRCVSVLLAYIMLITNRAELFGAELGGGMCVEAKTEIISVSAFSRLVEWGWILLDIEGHRVRDVFCLALCCGRGSGGEYI